MTEVAYSPSYKEKVTYNSPSVKERYPQTARLRPPAAQDVRREAEPGNDAQPDSLRQGTDQEGVGVTLLFTQYITWPWMTRGAVFVGCGSAPL
jgi:hypothetical protein